MTPRRYLARDVVTKLEVVNKKYVRVYTNTSPTPVCHFRIGAVNVFQENLEDAQAQLSRPAEAFLPITFAEHTNWLYVNSLFLLFSSSFSS